MSKALAQETAATYPAPAYSATRPIRLAPPLGWRVAQMVTDLLTVSFAAMVTYGTYLGLGLGFRHFDPLLYVKFSFGFASVTVFALHGYGVYRNQMGLLRIEVVKRILHGVGASLLLLIAMSFVIRSTALSRITVLMLGPAIILALVSQRFVFWELRRKVRALHRASRPALIYGAGETGRLLAQHLTEEDHLGLKPVGFIDDDTTRNGERVKIGPGISGERIPVIGSQDDLEDAMERTNAAVVFLAMPSSSSDRIAELVAVCESYHIPYFFVPSAGELLFSGLQFGQVAGMPVFTRRQAAENRGYAIASRGVDVAVAAMTLLLTAPIIALAAALIKLTSPGPILFKQERIGQYGKPFKIYKLRSMHVDAPKYAHHPSAGGDARVFKVGAWMRRLSIDELPQLVNVLRGEMGLVGPRPEMPFLVESYNDIQRQRLLVKPGITGLWQISADRAFEIHNNLQYDLYYIENRSLSLDAALLLMTPFVLLARNRAA